MEHNIFIASLTIWREARSESHQGMRAVGHVIFNRATQLSIKESLKNLPELNLYRVCIAPWQFSSITAKGDQQLGLYPTEDDKIFKEAVSIINNIVTEKDSDNTFGATYYFNPSLAKPAWANKFIKTVTIGHHDFYKSS